MIAQGTSAPDNASSAFFEGLAAGQLKIQRCGACGAHQLAGDFCFKCRSSELDWVDGSGRGHVHSFVMVHSVFDPAFAHEVPYLAALVELREGPRLFARLRGVTPEEARVGMPVSAVIVELAAGVFAPVFAPLEGMDQ